jgi:hypothetical protein
VPQPVPISDPLAVQSRRAFIRHSSADVTKN